MGKTDESPTICITFPLEPGQPLSHRAERFAFWYQPTTIEWFKKRGYMLYESIAPGTSRPTFPSAPCSEAHTAHHPFAYYDLESIPPEEPLQAEDASGKVVFAQDSLNRHVAIKLVRDDTDEYRILRFLNEQSMKTLEENCVIPVLDLLPVEGHWFAVMPRGGVSVASPTFWKLSDAVNLIHCMLKGLAYLHNNNISHGDISFGNVLINHFANEGTYFNSSTRQRLQRRQCLTYALFDFDFSTMFPLDADKRELRLPYDRSWGSFNLTGDTDGGEYDYDPFAFDVGGMGVTLRYKYESLIPVFPALAPLFDMMSTWDVRRRFTATEALEFYESCVSELSKDQLETDIQQQLSSREVVEDLWEALPPDLAERWKMYKSLPQPWSRRLLCWISDRRWMCHIVPWTRRVCFQFFVASPRRFYRWLFLSKVQL